MNNFGTRMLWVLSLLQPTTFLPSHLAIIKTPIVICNLIISFSSSNISNFSTLLRITIHSAVRGFYREFICLSHMRISAQQVNNFIKFENSVDNFQCHYNTAYGIQIMMWTYNIQRYKTWQHCTKVDDFCLKFDDKYCFSPFCSIPVCLNKQLRHYFSMSSLGLRTIQSLKQLFLNITHKYRFTMTLVSLIGYTHSSRCQRLYSYLQSLHNADIISLYHYTTNL